MYQYNVNNKLKKAENIERQFSASGEKNKGDLNL